MFDILSRHRNKISNTIRNHPNAGKLIKIEYNIYFDYSWKLYALWRKYYLLRL